MTRREITAWAWYWAGDRWNAVTYNNIQHLWEWPYRVYSWLMNKSLDAQGAEPNAPGPWKSTRNR